MAKQAINIRLFSLKQISHPGANLQKANARPWEQVQLRMPDKCPGGGGRGVGQPWNWLRHNYPYKFPQHNFHLQYLPLVCYFLWLAIIYMMKSCEVMTGIADFISETVDFISETVVHAMRLMPQIRYGILSFWRKK